jgi:hypothetical protein
MRETDSIIQPTEQGSYDLILDDIISPHLTSMPFVTSPSRHCNVTNKTSPKHENILKYVVEVEIQEIDIFQEEGKYKRVFTQAQTLKSLNL